MTGRARDARRAARNWWTASFLPMTAALAVYHYWGFGAAVVVPVVATVVCLAESRRHVGWAEGYEAAQPRVQP